MKGKRNKYLYGDWEARASHDLCVAWMKEQELDDIANKWCWDLVAEDARPISEGQKFDEARIQYMGGDNKVALLFKNDSTLIVLSTDSCIQVLCVINRDKQVTAFTTESY